MIRIILLILLLPNLLFSQSYQIKGIVINQKDKKPIPYANIQIKNSTRGIQADSLGQFQISISKNIDTLFVSMVGFNKKNVLIHEKEHFYTILLQEQLNDLETVIVKPSENPAWQIIRNSLKNRHLNDPNQYNYFQSSVYTKIIIGSDSLKYLRKEGSNIEKKLNKDVFIFENYSRVFHQNPNKNKEVVVASVNNFFQVYSQFINSIPFDLHPYFFYQEQYYHTLQKIFYVNPLCKKTFELYDLELKDTLISEKDTTFIINFRPVNGKNFNGFVGRVGINSKDYAIRSINLLPSDNKLNLDFEINQEYNKVQGKWFPVVCQTKISTKSSEGKFQVRLLLNFESYFSETTFENKENIILDEVQKEMQPEATIINNIEFDKFRLKKLSDSEEKLYNFGKNSKLISEIQKVDSKYSYLTSFLFAGIFEYKQLEIHIRDLLHANSYEGGRLSIGLQNNQRLKPQFRLYSNLSYGILDNKFKYSILGSWHITTDRYNKITLYQTSDIRQTGQTNFLDANYLVEKSNLLPLALNDSVKRSYDVEYYTKQGMAIHFKPFQWNWFSLDFSTTNVKPHYNSRNDRNIPFKSTEISLDWRFAFREQLYRIGRNETVINRFFPIINFQINKSLKILNGEFDYWKYTFQTFYQIRYKKIGVSNITLTTGYINGKIPYSVLYGSFGSRGILLNSQNAQKSFRTLQSNTFLADKYISIQLSHDLNKSLFKINSKYSQPRFLVYSNTIFGDISSQNLNSLDSQIPLLRKHLEVGLEINDLVRIPLRGFKIGTGVGLAYNLTNQSNLLTADRIRVYWLGFSPSR